jgi:hypothetical protein
LQLSAQRPESALPKPVEAETVCKEQHGWRCVLASLWS